MERIIIFFTLTLLLLPAGRAEAGQIDADLHRVLETMSDDEIVSTIVMLDHQVDLTALNDELDAMHATRAYRHETVIRSLKRKSVESQDPFRAFLEKGVAENQVAKFSSLWIANLVVVDAQKDFIVRISEREDVGDIYLNYEIEGIEPVAAGDAPGGAVASIEEGLERINAPLAWARGYTGAGRLVSHLDTGADGNHPAFASRWRGTHAPPSQTWFDPVTHTTFPFDSATHGTHTMGTICGYEVATDDHIGVAPDAEWIAAAVIDRVDIPTTIADAIAAFQWTADPDGNPETVDDVPDVSSNSWGLSPFYHGIYLNGACDPVFWSVIDACEAAGIVVVYAAGNEGDIDPPNSIRNPANRGVGPYNSFCVGAIDGSDYGNDPAAWFSSRGPAPSDCGGWTTKPEVSAPGVEIRSSLPGGSYGIMSGTSMATPHVAGAVAILRQKDPNASSDQVKYALMQSAQDLGSQGEDNTYGWGLIDIDAALDILGASGGWWELNCSPHDMPIILPEAGGTFSFDASLTNHSDSSRTTDVWTMVRLPDYSLYGPVLRFQDVPFGANETRSVANMTHAVPGGAPTGAYQYRIYYGDYPSAPQDSCYFNFFKQGAGGGGPYNALILLSNDTSDASLVVNALMNDGRFLTADAMNVQNYTPTIHDLLPYDVVQVWSYYDFDQVALGDVLADYVDVGGAVVLSQFSFTSQWALGGRMMSMYSPLGIGSNYWVPVTLGSYDPNHPIMFGISTLAEDRYSVDAPTQGNVDLVASWDNGNPCVAVNADLPRVVALNMYFGAFLFDVSGDWERLLGNALAFAADNSYLRVAGWDSNDFSMWDENSTSGVGQPVVGETGLPATPIQTRSPGGTR